MCEQKSPSQWRLFWDSVYQDLSGQDPTFVAHGLRESAQWTADRRATAIDYYSDVMVEKLNGGTAFAGVTGRFIFAGGPEGAAGLRFNLTADHMFSPYVTAGGGIGGEVSIAGEAGFIPGAVSRFNGTSFNLNGSGAIGGSLTVPFDGGFYPMGGALSAGAGGGVSGTVNHTWSGQ